MSNFCLLHLSLINSVWLWKMDFTLKVTCLCLAGGHKFSCKCLDLGLNENRSPALSADHSALPVLQRQQEGLIIPWPCASRDKWSCGAADESWGMRAEGGKWTSSYICLQGFQIQERRWLRSSWKWRWPQALVSAHSRKVLRPSATLQTGLWDENNSRHSGVGPNLQVQVRCWPTFPAFCLINW